MFIIKGTYTKSGRSFFLDKEGYVVVNINYLRPHECYNTAKGAKMVATKKTKANKEQADYYNRCNERRIAEGKEPRDYYFNECVYEAYEINI